MALTTEQINKGVILSTVTYHNGTTIPFYYETGVLGCQLIDTIKDAMGKYQVITIADTDIAIVEVMSVRDLLTNEVVYFDTDGEAYEHSLQEEAFKEMPLEELYEALTTLSEFIGTYHQDDEAEEDKEWESLLEAEAECIWELGKRLGFRKDYSQ